MNLKRVFNELVARRTALDLFILAQILWQRSDAFKPYLTGFFALSNSTSCNTIKHLRVLTSDPKKQFFDRIIIRAIDSQGCIAAIAAFPIAAFPIGHGCARSSLPFYLCESFLNSGTSVGWAQTAGQANRRQRPLKSLWQYRCCNALISAILVIDAAESAIGCGTFGTRATAPAVAAGRISGLGCEWLRLWAACLQPALQGSARRLLLCSARERHPKFVLVKFGTGVNPPATAIAAAFCLLNIRLLACDIRHFLYCLCCW